MELSKALPIVRAAVKQVNVIRTTETIQSGMMSGARTLHSSGYMGRQEKTTTQSDNKKNPMGGDTVESLKQRASQATEAVKETASNLKETIKEKTGLGSPSGARRTGGERSGSPSREGQSYQGVQQQGGEFQRNKTLEKQGREFDNIAKGSSKMGAEGKGSAAKGSSQMGAEGNTWDANQRQAKECTAEKPGAADKTIVEKATDMLKGATNTVTEKLGLKK